jgi:RHS repeat-associated protein
MRAKVANEKPLGQSRRPRLPDSCYRRRLSAGFSRGWPQAIAQRREAPSTGSGRRRTAATYDGAGLRGSTTITPSGGSATTQGYVWNTIPRVPQLIMDGTNAYIYDGGLAPAEQVNISSGTINYLATDSLGSVRGTVGLSGSLTGSTAYDAWGNAESTGGLTATTPFGYAGGYTDPDGLVYLINRYYQPSTGQFISVDPDIAQTLAPYGYVNGNPVTNTDPLGLGKNSRPGHVCHWSWGTGTCWWTLNNASTDYTIRVLKLVELGDEEADEAISLLPGFVGFIIEGLGFGCGWLADKMENANDLGGHYGVVIHVDFAVWVPWWFGIRPN